MNPYDEVDYTNRPYRQTHPDHIAALARLHGLDPPPPDRARVLDIGASEGGNILPMAEAMPESEFVGIDLAAVPIQRGQEAIAALGLRNIRLAQMNLLDLDESFGKFDYIIAHGLYAWTPPEVGDKILQIAETNLSANGIAFISYNTHPGGHFRKLVRDMMLFACGRESEPAKRLHAARAMLALVGRGCPEPDAIEAAVAHQARSVGERDDSSLYHDYLAPVFEPVYFFDFAGHSARHGLAYVADADVGDTYNMKLSPEAMEAVRGAAGAGRIAQEQLLDFLRLRRFRRSLVCRAEHKPWARWNPERAMGLYASSSAIETEEESTFLAGRLRVTLESTAVRYLRRLIAQRPRAEAIAPEDADIALELYRREMVELRVLPGLASPAGETPKASRLARYQAAKGDAAVATLRHRSLAIGDPRARKLLTLLDGSRDREELAREMECSREELDAQLKAIEHHALLME
ncbi:MAG TPA: class I SAM-dependent methyltransferase [Bryobacteraceae bacterium]|nr:class I SAM-dependent methyltransferase [Bryobacteraceae bacterium]